MKIVGEGKKVIKVIKIIIENTDEIDKAYNYAEKKFKHFKMFWDYNFYDKTKKDLLIIRKANLRKCQICGEKDVCDFEFEVGERVYKICPNCWVKMNS